MAGAITMAFVPQERLAPNMVNAVAAPSFSDVAGHQYEPAITRWALLGVVQGDNGMVYPDSQATRVEFLATMNRVLGVAVSRRAQVFNDVTTNDWFYDEVQKAYAAGLTIGVGNDMFAPKQLLNREMMVTLMGRIFGLYSENTSILADIYADETTATYGRGFLAAFAEMGVTLPVDGNFDPLRIVTRAEMFKFISDFLPNVLGSTDNLSGRTINSNVLIRTPGATVDNMILNGSLIIGDGVENGNITLRNCKINGRLIVRGGGPNSVNLTGTVVTEGVYVYNANCDTRIYNTNIQSKIGEVTAMTGVILEGPGFSTLRIPLNAVDNSGYVLRDVALDSLNIERSNTSVRLESVSVDNIRIAGSAYSSNLYIGKDARVNYLELGGDDVTVQGDGTVDYLVINGDNASVSMKPNFVSIAPGLSATVNGEVIKGSEVGTATSINNVTRSTPEMGIKRDAGNTGGTGLTLATSSISNANLVTITPDATAVQMTDQSRLGYWIGFLIPAPPKSQDPAVKIGYTFEGSGDFVYSIPNVSQNNIKGILVYIPVRAKADLTGSIDTTLDITWGNGVYERLSFKGSNFKLAQPTSAQITRMVNQFGNSNYPSYNKIATFTGSEALKRLLLADNPLGIDTRSFDVFAEEEKNSFASQMYTDRASLTSKPAIQNYINSKITSVGGLHMINSVMTAAELQKILEDDAFAGQLGINTLKGSDYDNLSAYGKLNVANAMLVARNALAGGKFANEEAVAAEFEKQVAARRKIEVTLLSTINNTADSATMQKLYENKTNAEVIGIVVASDPYKSMAAAQKTNVAAKIVAGRQFTNLDAVRKIFEDLVGTPDKPITLAPEDNPNITGVAAEPAVINLVVGTSENFLPIINTSSGSYSTFSSVTMTIANSNIASLDASRGLLTGKTKGKTTVTILSNIDKKKKATVTVNVVDPVATTALSISPSSISIIKGSYAQLTLNVTPKTGNDKVEWFSDDDKIATVSNGLVTGVSPGYTSVTAKTSRGIRATCSVYVSDTQPGVTIDRRGEPFTVGIEGTLKLTATVSPITQSNTGITWGSSNPSIATVNSSGVVIGQNVLSRQEVTITATANAFKDVSDSVTVVVDPSRYSLALSYNTLTMYKNGVYQLVATVKPNGTGKVTWGSSDEKIVKVTQSGLVTAYAAGTAIVSASYDDDPNATDTCEITVDPSTLTAKIVTDGLDKNNKISAGGSFYIEVQFTPPTILNNIVDFSVDQPALATLTKVSNNKVRVDCIKDGKINVSVTPQATGITSAVTAEITPLYATGIEINPPSLTMGENGIRTLTAVIKPEKATVQKVEWSWDNSTVLEVLPATDGKTATIIAKKTTYVTEEKMVDNPDYGKPTSWANPDDKTSTPTSFDERKQIGTPTSVNYPVTVTAKVTSGNNTYTTTSKITITDVPDGDNFDEIEIGMTRWVFTPNTAPITLQVNFYNNGVFVANPKDILVTWDTSDRNVAYVDNENRLIAVSPGVVRITATSRVATIQNTKLVVVAPIAVNSISFSGLDTSNGYGDWLKMSLTGNNKARTVTATALPTGAAYGSLAFRSSDTSIVRVDSNGKLDAVGSGVTAVNVYTDVYRYSNGYLKDLTDDELKQNGITKIDDKFYNEADLKNPLKETEYWPLVRAERVQKAFTVLVESLPLTNLVLTVDEAITAGNKFTSKAVPTPSNATVDSLKWTAQYYVGTSKIHEDTLTVTSPILNKVANAFLQELPAPPLGATTVYISCLGITADKKINTDPNDSTNKSKGIWQNSTQKEMELYGTKPNTELGEPCYPEIMKSVSTIPVTGIDPIMVSYNGTAVTTGKITLGTALPFTLSAIISPSNASNKNVYWSSSNPNVATISSVGNISAIATTTSVTFTATSAENATITQSITLAIDPAPTSGSVARIITTAVPSLAIATTAETTTATTAAAGSAPVSMTRETQQLISQLVKNVLEKDNDPVMPTSIRIRGGSAKVLVNKTLKLYPNLKPTNANMLVWHSSDETVATVDNNGLVKGKMTGNAKITVTSPDGTVTSNVCTVFVVDSNPRPVEKLKLSRENLKMFIGQDVTLDTTVTPKDATMKGLNWYSSNPKVATVGTGGKIIAVNGGTCTITAVTDDGVKAYCTVSVKVRVKSVTLDTRTLTLKVGGDQKLLATVTPSNASTNVVTWKSKDENVATVSTDGTVKAHSRGETVITATCDGKNITCTVTVID